LQLATLHHDDTEAFVGDLPKPLKVLLPDYKQIEDRVEALIVEALGLPMITREEKALIKEADLWALAGEAYYLMPSKGVGWFSEGAFNPAEPVIGWISDIGLPPTRARDLWMSRHQQLITAMETEELLGA
jgi:hypothetical protein